MKKFLGYTLAGLVIILAFYGAAKLLSGFMTKSQGSRAAEVAQPFVQGAASAAAEKLKQSLKEVPDAKLEQDSEWLAKKLYPITKGIIKGQVDSFLQDPNRNELSEKMYQAGKEFSDKVLRPFSRGIVDSNKQTLDDADKTLQAIRKFGDTNKDLLDAVTQGLDALGRNFRENPPPRPEAPGMAPRPVPRPPFSEAPDATPRPPEEPGR
ncbi:MAG: hypothetical protein ACLP5H_21775 [Desulfomonilaceae bacterium]